MTLRWCVDDTKGPGLIQWVSGSELMMERGYFLQQYTCFYMYLWKVMYDIILFKDSYKTLKPSPSDSCITSDSSWVMLILIAIIIDI